MNINEETAGVARARIFLSLVMQAGEIKRGILTSRMHISTQTFAREYRDYLDQYTAIQYDVRKRTFKYEP